MKITKSYLKQIIKEEIGRLVEQEEVPHDIKRLQRPSEEYVGKMEAGNNFVYVFKKDGKIITYAQSKTRPQEVGRNDRVNVSAQNVSTGEPRSAEEIMSALHKLYGPKEPAGPSVFTKTATDRWRTKGLSDPLREETQQEEIPEKVLARKTGKFIGKIVEDTSVRYYFSYPIKKYSRYGNKADDKPVGKGVMGLMYFPSNNEVEKLEGFEFKADKTTGEIPSDEEIFKNIEFKRKSQTAPKGDTDIYGGRHGGHIKGINMRSTYG